MKVKRSSCRFEPVLGALNAGPSDRKPEEDKMNKDWDRSRESRNQGGQAGQDMTDKQNPTDRDRMGGQQSQSDTQQWDKNL